MRNTAQFPITKVEVLGTLNDAQEALATEAIGDIRPYILRRIVDVIERMSDDEFARIFHH